MPTIEITPQIVLIIEYEVAKENRKKFLELMAESAVDTIQDEGCTRMELSQPVTGEDGSYFLTELWRDQSCIDKHRLKPGHSKVHEDIDALLVSKRVSKLNSFAVDGWTQIPDHMLGKK